MQKIRPSEWMFIVALLMFAAGLRLIGNTFGQPDPRYFPSYVAEQRIHKNVSIHPDEFLFVSIPLRMLVLRQFNPQFFHNPSFLINANLVTFALTGAQSGITPEMRVRVDERTYAPFHLYVIGRLYSALGGLLAVAVSYATARMIAGRYAALIAGLLIAISLPMVQHAHYATTSSLAAGFAMLAVWAAFRCLQDRRLRWWMFALSGAAAGFAAGNRYNAAGVGLVTFLVGLVLLWRARSWRVGRVVLFGWCCMPAAFILSTPHVILDPEAVWQQFVQISRQYLGTGAPLYITADQGLFFEYRYLVLFGLGAAASLFVPIGLYAAYRSFPGKQLFLKRNTLFLSVSILLLYLLAYSFVVLRTVRPDGADQLLVPVIPVVGLVAGVGAGWAHARLLAPHPALASLLAVALICVPLASSIQFVRQLTQPDTRQLMEQWINAHIPSGAHIHLNGPYNVALDDDRYSWTQSYGGDFKPLSEILNEGVGYIVLSDAFYFGELRAAEIHPPQYMMQVREYLKTYSNSELLKEIARIERPAWTGYDWMGHTPSYWHNPGLRVYCVGEASCAAVRG